MKITIEIETENRLELIEIIQKIRTELKEAPDDFFTKKATFKEDTKRPRYELGIIEPL